MFTPEISDTKRTTDATRTTDGVPGLFDALDDAFSKTITALEKAYANGSTVFSDAKVNTKEDCLEFKGMNYDAFQLALSTKDNSKTVKQADDFIKFLENHNV
jgi:hypothetical protein